MLRIFSGGDFLLKIKINCDFCKVQCSKNLQGPEWIQAKYFTECMFLSNFGPSIYMEYAIRMAGLLLETV